MKSSANYNQYVLKRRQIAQGISERLSPVPGISSIAVIGSVATGKANINSDIDLLVTYSAPIDRATLDHVFDTIGRHASGIATSDDIQIITTALRVDGIDIFPIIGPEAYLLNIARKVDSESSERYQLCYYSYQSAIVLYDPHSIWPGVIQAVREAGYRHGLLPPAE